MSRHSKLSFVREDVYGKHRERMMHSIIVIGNSKTVFHDVNVVTVKDTAGEWILRFDDVVADAPELGALRCKTLALTPEQEQWVESVTPKEIPLRIAQTITAYYLANRNERLLD